MSKADRFARRQRMTGKRAKAIHFLRSSKRAQRTKKAIDEEMKAVSEGQAVSSIAGEARTLNPMKAARKKLGIKGKKASKIFYRLWCRYGEYDDFKDLLRKEGLIA